MALIDHIDPVGRKIYLSVETMNTAWHPVDLYREVRALRRTDETLRAYDNFIKGDGNIDKGGGKATERYFTLLGGTRIYPWNDTHIIDVTGTLITDDGFEGAFCFVKTELSAGVSVDIQYAPKQVEVINLNFDDLVYSSFQGAVWVDVNSPYSDIGTSNYPNGNAERPVSSIQLASQIATDKGFTEIRLKSSITLSTGDDIVGFNIFGHSAVNVTVTIEDGANISNCTFRSMAVQGVLDNGNILRECNVLDISHNNGFIHQCSLSGVITLGGNTQSTIMSCYSGFAGSALTATIDMGGSGNPLVLRDFSGGVKITNRNGTDGVSIDMSSGQAIIDETVTAGEITVRGVCYLTNNGTGTSTVNTAGLLNSEIIATEVNALTPGTFMALKG